MFKKKTVERVCGNCRLYDGEREVCRVVVLIEGQQVNLPVHFKDPCFYEGMPGMPSFTEDVQQVKFWVENDKGEKIDGFKENGIVKMQCPEGWGND